ncbi:potassium transporter Kup [Rhizobium sp. C1]|uniref:potassium transporter Kup n=1 Tax=Rhizobium sp. C1 TaxID=1349799 RepID=UPI001E2DA1D7|nr:potassium transporter Kup [Rhizobium sp. C1]MCD2179739.1 potassium transporter Kup [Rhizobium sp. C1]
MSNSVDNEQQGPSGLKSLLTLALGSVGVVYGDIGTSPLYAFKEALRPVSVDGIDRGEVVGIISLMLWTLTIIVTLKYVLFLLRADNGGEGGTLSLLALLMKTANGHAAVLFFMGIAGSALFLGDSMITPALSVLSAVEGLQLVTPELKEFVLPLSLTILIALFLVQSRGTGAVSAFFGPITAIWFLVMGVIGIVHIADDLTIFTALNPYHAATFLFREQWLGVVVLGAVFLTVTGAEALYADLGHFGRRPIQLAWFALVFPALMLNYLGQGAFILKHPEAAENPFFLMFPSWALLPAVILATAATIIASQAVITGAFSLVRQAIHLNFLPRMEIQHTSETHTGQIFLPGVNIILMIGVVFLVLGFRSSDALATAYGISVTGAMTITTVMAFEFVRKQWHWSLAAAIAGLLPLLLLELVFLGANLFKIHDGGYVPILIAAGIVIVMWTWRRGSRILAEKAKANNIPIDKFIEMVSRESEHAPATVPGTAIFLTSDPGFAPATLLHNIKHNHVLHKQNIILSVRTANKPYVPDDIRYSLSHLSDRFTSLEVRFGFMEMPDITKTLGRIRKEGMKFEIMSTSFYLGRRQLLASPDGGMPLWQDKLFIALANTATRPSDYFRLPSNRVVELGSQVVI